MERIRGPGLLVGGASRVRGDAPSLVGSLGDTMSMLVFMPWCPIDKVYRAGNFCILPFGHDSRIDGLDEAILEQLNTMMQSYKNIDGNPVERSAIIRHGDRLLVDDLSDEQRDMASSFITIACFSGLANRGYFNPCGHYCNVECFDVYVQDFSNADFTVFDLRRREGPTFSGWLSRKVSITIPLQCHTIQGISLDAELLDGLAYYRDHTENSEWARWENAISCFNQANTDSNNVPYHTEWVLLCSAFEHILSAKPKAKDVADSFARNLVPDKELPITDVPRFPDSIEQHNESVRHLWMREFYRIRGDFAHGRLNVQQPTIWNPREHLMLATIAFPLLVKLLLNKASDYALTGNDQAQINVFEKFAGACDFLTPPRNQKGSLDSHWGRLLNECVAGTGFVKAFNQAWDNLSVE